MLGPQLFIAYTADLADKAAEHGVNFHSFPDDMQLYLHCRRGDTTSAVDIGHWMSGSRLKLNKKKELLWVGSRYNLSALHVAARLCGLRRTQWKPKITSECLV